jgi:hypothetical protein
MPVLEVATREPFLSPRVKSSLVEGLEKALRW